MKTEWICVAASESYTRQKDNRERYWIMSWHWPKKATSLSLTRACSCSTASRRISWCPTWVTCKPEEKEEDIQHSYFPRIKLYFWDMLLPRGSTAFPNTVVCIFTNSAKTQPKYKFCYRFVHSALLVSRIRSHIQWMEKLPPSPPELTRPLLESAALTATCAYACGYIIIAQTA